MRRSPMICCVLLALMPVGCVRVIHGRNFDMRRADLIKRNESTKEDVRSLLGEPYTIQNPNDGPTAEIWIFTSLTSTIGVAKMQQFGVGFDENGIVRTTYRSNEGHGRIIHGRDFDMRRADLIKRNESTKEDVRSLLGEPYTVKTNAVGENIWEYVYITSTSTTSSSGVNVHVQGFTVEFDGKDIVRATDRYINH